MPNFQFWRRAKWPWWDKILGAPQRGQKIFVYLSKLIWVIYSLNKAFHSPEFQANLFFTRNWVGGFYWDSLLSAKFPFRKREFIILKITFWSHTTSYELTHFKKNGSLRKHPFLLVPRRLGRFVRRNVCDSATEIPYWWCKICPEYGQKRWLVDGAVTLF